MKRIIYKAVQHCTLVRKEHLSGGEASESKLGPPIPGTHLLDSPALEA